MRTTISNISRALKAAVMLSAGAIAISCEVEFDIKGQFADSMVYVDMIATAGADSTFLRVQAATPLKDSSNPVYTRDENIEVLVNGSSLLMQKDMRRSSPSGYQVYFTDRKLLPEDKIEIRAEVPGSGTAQSECVVPGQIKDFRYDTRIIKDGQDEYVRFNISFPNDGEYSGYYGVAVEVESFREVYFRAYDENTGDYLVDENTGENIWKLNSSSTNVRANNPVNIGADLGVSSSGDSPMTFPMTRNANHCPVAAWSDKTGSGDTSFQVNVHFDNDIIRDYGSSKLINKYRYRLVLYDFSESAYKHYKSTYSLSTSDLSEIGLAAPSFLYTNIRNGVGVCGAYTVSESDWISLAY